MTTLTSAVTALQLLGEPTRVRLLALLAREELTVAELVAITEVAQSSVSTHLGKLRDAGIVRDRRAGASTFYALNAPGAMPPEAQKLWALVESELADGVLDADRERCARVVRARARAAWPEGVAGEMERHYSPGRTWEATAKGLVGLARLGDVLDAGSGDGTIAQLVAPRARSVTCIDRSARLVAAARERLARVKNARCEVGDVEALPFPDASFDEVLLFNVLTQCPSPARALGEAARVLRPGGLVAIVTLAPHKHEETTAPYGDICTGFSPEKLRGMLKRAGLTVDHCDVTSREKRAPHFEVLTAFARRSE